LSENCPRAQGKPPAYHQAKRFPPSIGAAHLAFSVSALRQHPTGARRDPTMPFSPSLVQARYASPMGPILLAASNTGLAGLWFENQRHYPSELMQQPACWRIDPANAFLTQAADQLDTYFAGRRRAFDVPLDLSCGTAFQQTVWQALLGLGWGGTASYGQISALVGKPSAVRAVGSAVGRNPISIVVPCHRVLGGSGSLTGYAGGLERKRALLELEGVLQASLVLS
jgi:methylated-DNA-[protein]-cysteine S-methyltransferase